MKEIWYFIYIAISLMAFLLIPFASYYYETDDEQSFRHRFFTAMQFTICTFIIVGILVFIGFTFLHTAEIPVTSCTKNIASFESSTSKLSTVEANPDLT